jgi:PleD family two-component response regulator
VAAAIATIALTSFATVSLVRTALPDDLRLFHAIWPIVLTSAVAVILVMSTLYQALLEMVEELEQRELAAQHQALHDQLTGLANRALLEDRLKQVVGRYRRTGETAALLMLDLDRFKQVNDTLGHVAGDILVQEVGAASWPCCARRTPSPASAATNSPSCSSIPGIRSMSARSAARSSTTSASRSTLPAARHGSASASAR